MTKLRVASFTVAFIAAFIAPVAAFAGWLAPPAKPGLANSIDLPVVTIAPVAGVKLALLDAHERTLAHGATEADGSYHLVAYSAAPGGRYTLAVEGSGSGLAGGVFPLVVDANRVAAVDCEMRRTAPLRCRPALGWAGRHTPGAAADVRGKIGGTIGSVHVQAGTGVYQRSCVTDADGRCLLRGIQLRSNYLLKARSRNGLSPDAQQYWFQVFDQWSDIALGRFGQQPPRIGMDRLSRSTIAPHVFGGKVFGPAAPTRVIVYDASGAQIAEVTSNLDGKFRVGHPLPRGSYSVVLQPANRALRGGTISLTPAWGAEIWCTLLADRPPACNVIYNGAIEHPVRPGETTSQPPNIIGGELTEVEPGTMVTVSDCASGKTLGSAISNAEGDYRIPGFQFRASRQILVSASSPRGMRFTFAAVVPRYLLSISMQLGWYPFASSNSIGEIWWTGSACRSDSS